ncbi:DUF6272 family protein [Paracrocinitomix mangrovi]|uniref:DUF6272 family protein n=1 Tax=Paracrocinitomix mangrovi TaxID=2862509 RepID=UPI001C8E9E7E|nr:DUF6272 family protein [Paracrocinitomix mangrovi]UKN01293.1 DUF6272 family protein [Paracrocinitomix mangrovi]
MPHHLKILDQLRRHFKRDKVCLFYHGEFEDYFTEKMIALIGMQSDRKIRGNLAFVITESFQNIVRHKNSFLGEGNHNVFGIRGSEVFMHIFSSNLVVDEVKQELDDRLSEINSHNKDSLKELFLKILEEGELDERGGAGMGLIEMARRSKSKVQYEFVDLVPNVYNFNMQVDFMRLPEFSDCTPMSVDVNSQMAELIKDEEILFIYKGVFNESTIEPIIPIITSSIQLTKVNPLNVLKIVSGLVENIIHYSDEEYGQKHGLFAIKKIPDGIYISSGNYTNEDVEELERIVDDINYMSDDDLRSMSHRMNSAFSSEQIGLSEIRITSKNSVELKVSEDEKGTYVMLGVRITD